MLLFQMRFHEGLVAGSIRLATSRFTNCSAVLLETRLTAKLVVDTNVLGGSQDQPQLRERLFRCPPCRDARGPAPLLSGT